MNERQQAEEQRKNTLYYTTISNCSDPNKLPCLPYTVQPTECADLRSHLPVVEWE